LAAEDNPVARLAGPGKAGALSVPRFFSLASVLDHAAQLLVRFEAVTLRARDTRHAYGAGLVSCCTLP